MYEHGLYVGRSVMIVLLVTLLFPSEVKKMIETTLECNYYFQVHAIFIILIIRQELLLFLPP